MASATTPQKPGQARPTPSHRMQRGGDQLRGADADDHVLSFCACVAHAIVQTSNRRLERRHIIAIPNVVRRRDGDGGGGVLQPVVLEDVRRARRDVDGARAAGEFLTACCARPAVEALTHCCVGIQHPIAVARATGVVGSRGYRAVPRGQQDEAGEQQHVDEKARAQR
eukprot:CAMPEP_0113237552 /NCGR_PEP_ID=MMETSP0008_2-20120614/4684_1 /TAXON_ID=97485 /ORGANISM="Prymnesium parvum" /LENGTH=167 /DNA_ID=CAMNT_0000084621 /DNA_START=1391 /DNA_END=1895 /DNA_ORIENTATION=- /assembly_acc=CAM_ASM_000153